jgi:hypothetical protein
MKAVDMMWLGDPACPAKYLRQENKKVVRDYEATKIQFVVFWLVMPCSDVAGWKG